MTKSQKEILGNIEETMVKCETVERLSDTLISQLDRTDTDHLSYAANQALNRHLECALEVLAHYSDELIDMAISDSEITNSVAIKG